MTIVLFVNDQSLHQMLGTQLRFSVPATGSCSASPGIGSGMARDASSRGLSVNSAISGISS